MDTFGFTCYVDYSLQCAEDREDGTYQNGEKQDDVVPFRGDAIDMTKCPVMEKIVGV